PLTCFLSIYSYRCDAPQPKSKRVTFGGASLAPRLITSSIYLISGIGVFFLRPINPKVRATVTPQTWFVMRDSSEILFVSHHPTNSPRHDKQVRSSCHEHLCFRQFAFPAPIQRSLTRSRKGSRCQYLVGGRPTPREKYREYPKTVRSFDG